MNRNISNVFLLFSQNAQNPGLGQTLIPQNVGKDMRKLLLGMLAGNVDDRMTAKQAMEQMQGTDNATKFLSLIACSYLYIYLLTLLNQLYQ